MGIQFKKVNASEVEAIKAMQLHSNCINNGVITYGPSYKYVVGNTDTVDALMKSINTISKTDNGFTGESVDKNGSIYQFTVDIENKTISGLAGRKKIKFRARGSEHRARFRWGFMNKYINASTLIACLSLLSQGYVVDDWNKVRVNHIDNSAGSETALLFGEENLSPDNLELYVDCDKNTIHGKVWNKLYELGIRSSFSCYNSKFLAYIDKLETTGKLTLENVLAWPWNSKDGVIYFE